MKDLEGIPDRTMDLCGAEEEPLPPGAHEVAALSGLVAVKWLDHAAEPDWTPVEQLREDPQEIITVGILVKETADALILAASVSDLDFPKPQWVVAETTMILKPLIVWALPLPTALIASPASPRSGQSHRLESERSGHG